MDAVFKALAHPARRKILKLLREQDLIAGDLAAHFDFSKPSLSGHLALLKEADLVTTERRGKEIVYRLNISVSEEIVAAILDLVDPKRETSQWKLARASGTPQSS